MKTLILILVLASTSLFAQTNEPSYVCEGKGFKGAPVSVETSAKKLTFTETESVDARILKRRTLFNVLIMKGQVVDKASKRVTMSMLLKLNLNYMRGSLTVASSTPTGFKETTYPLSCRVK